MKQDINNLYQLIKYDILILFNVSIFQDIKLWIRRKQIVKNGGLNFRIHLCDELTLAAEIAPVGRDLGSFFVELSDFEGGREGLQIHALRLLSA